MRLSALFRGIALLACFCLPIPQANAGNPFVEVKVSDRTLSGRVVAHNQQQFWIVSRDGRLADFPFDEVTSFKPLTGAFRPYTSGEARDVLRRELGSPFEVLGTGHYIVCAHSGRGQALAQEFEDLYRKFHVYFSARGFTIREPEFPLIAIVFPDQKAFARYASRDGIQAGPSLKGYYHPLSNRIALFDADRTISRNHQPDDALSTALADTAWGAVEADLQDTIVHEATHQVAFNCGLHSRTGTNPKWAVEGLATVFESPGIRDPGNRSTLLSRVNRERFVWFGNYAKGRRKPKSLAAFVSTDDLFASSALDAYSQAWALTFYLIETRSSNYARYLQTVVNRDPLKPYGPEARLADFQQAFGKDLTVLEADFLRFIATIR